MAAQERKVALGETDKPVLGARIRREKFGSLVFRLGPHLQLLALNRTATNILERCDGRASVGDIQEQIAARYPRIPRSRIRSDVLTFLATSMDQGILKC